MTVNFKQYEKYNPLIGTYFHIHGNDHLNPKNANVDVHTAPEEELKSTSSISNVLPSIPATLPPTSHPMTIHSIRQPNHDTQTCFVMKHLSSFPNCDGEILENSQKSTNHIHKIGTYVDTPLVINNLIGPLPLFSEEKVSDDKVNQNPSSVKQVKQYITACYKLPSIMVQQSEPIHYITPTGKKMFLNEIQKKQWKLFH